MKKISWKIFGWLCFITISIFLFAKKLSAFEGAEFDPGGNIAKATKLPTKSPINITINTIKWALGLLGLVAVIFVIYGGFTWMTAAGNEERLKKAKEIIKAAVIGLVVILISWSLVTFVFERIQSSTT